MNHMCVFSSPIALILLIDKSTMLKMSLIAQEIFSEQEVLKFPLITQNFDDTLWPLVKVAGSCT
jgi:hypothetical protein